MPVKFVKRVFSYNGNSKASELISELIIKKEMLVKVLKTGDGLLSTVNKGVSDIKNGGKSAAELKQKSEALDIRIKALKIDVQKLAKDIKKVKSGTISDDTLKALSDEYNRLFDEVEKMNLEVAEKQEKGYELSVKLFQLEEIKYFLNQCNEKLPTSDDPKIKALLEEVAIKITEEQRLQKEKDDSEEELERAEVVKRENEETKNEIHDAMKEVKDKKKELLEIMPAGSPSLEQIMGVISKTQEVISGADLLLGSATCDMAVSVTSVTDVSYQTKFSSFLAAKGIISAGSFDFSPPNLTQIADQQSVRSLVDIVDDKVASTHAAADVDGEAAAMGGADDVGDLGVSNFSEI